MSNESPIRVIAFLPWLSLAESVTIAGTEFAPFRDPNGNVNPKLTAIEDTLLKILSSYVDLRGEAVNNFTVVLRDGMAPGWDVATDDFENIHWTVSLLSLCSLAQNDYFQPVLARYVNNTMFQLYGQNFTEPVDFISLRAKKRDGGTLVAGHRHGSVKFTVPLQCESLSIASVDNNLVSAFNHAIAANSALIERLRPALSFLNLANTDGDGMIAGAEVILMASAFEQLLSSYGARNLSTAFSNIQNQYGGVIVANAINSRAGLVVEPRYAADQQNWFVHRKWMEEFYQLRNAYVHGTALSARTWGWQTREHLVVGAFVFPLTVKLCLQEEGYYVLDDQDEIRCRAIDPLLAATNWERSPDDRANASCWQDVLSDGRRDLRVRKAMEARRLLVPDI